MVARHLVTTAVYDTWPAKNVPTILLGEWCKINAHESVWKNRNVVVVPYHWDDREKFKSDCLYLENLYESLLRSLAAKLNEIHQVQYSLRYWRIAVGQWLSYFIQVLFDRWSMVVFAKENYTISEIKIIQRCQGDLVPNDLSEFISLVLSDEWNEMIYGLIIAHNSQQSSMTIRPVGREIVDERLALPVHSDKHPSTFKIKSKKLLSKAGSFFSRDEDCFIYDTYLNRSDFFCLNMKLRQFPCFWRNENADAFAFDKRFREWSLQDSVNGDAFLRLVSKLLPEHIPRAFLEGFDSIKSRLGHLPWPQNPKSIFTSVAWNSDTIFCVYAADKVEKGAKLILGQHGGNYGAALYNANENHQIAISDKFLSWGWTGSSGKVLPVGYFKNGLKELKAKKEGVALLIQMALPRQSYTLYSCPISSCQWLKYINDQFKFFNSLDDNVKKSLTIKCHPTDHGCNQENRWLGQDPTLHLETAMLPDALRKSRIAICTYNSSTFIETFVINFPTICFWYPDHWELRESAKPFFERLKSVGILHDTPESAAKQLSSVWSDITSWWQSAEVQEAVSFFCGEFAATPSNSIENIVKAHHLSLSNCSVAVKKAL